MMIRIVFHTHNRSQACMIKGGFLEIGKEQNIESGRRNLAYLDSFCFCWSWHSECRSRCYLQYWKVCFEAEVAFEKWGNGGSRTWKERSIRFYMRIGGLGGVPLKGSGKISMSDDDLYPEQSFFGPELKNNTESKERPA